MKATGGLAVLAALIGSTNAEKMKATSFGFDSGKYKTEGTVSFVRHPDTGKPYISVKASYSDVELKDGLAMCYDFTPATVDKNEFIYDKDAGYPVNFVVPKGQSAANPEAYV